MNYVFMDKYEGKELIGFVENNRLVDLYADGGKKEVVSYIYRGRVKDVVDGMNSAFIDIGSNKNAFLSLKDALPLDYLYEDGDYKISDFLKEGEDIIVQVKKDGTETKGAKVSTHIELPSKNIILTPYSEKIRISRKIKDREEVSRLREIAQGMKFENIGMIIRTSAYLEDSVSLVKEYEGLVEDFKKIQREKNFLPCPKLIYKPLEDWELGLVRRLGQLDRIIVKTKEDLEDLRELLRNHNLNEDKLSLDPDYNFIYDKSVYNDFKTALARKVRLGSGGSIVIDQLEALTAIDVNTESIAAKKTFRKNILKTNLEAALAISREIRLRNLSGIILVDFINMEKKEDRDKLIESLEREFQKDSVKANIYGFTKLGLLEIARTKKRKSLKEIFN